jgi:hypothetical protein
MQAWKADHEKKINSLFDFPQIRNERELLEQVNELLTENRVIFEEYGLSRSRHCRAVLGMR